MSQGDEYFLIELTIILTFNSLQAHTVKEETCNIRYAQNVQIHVCAAHSTALEENKQKQLQYTNSVNHSNCRIITLCQIIYLQLCVKTLHG